MVFLLLFFSLLLLLCYLCFSDAYDCIFVVVGSLIVVVFLLHLPHLLLVCLFVVTTALVTTFVFLVLIVFGCRISCFIQKFLFLVVVVVVVVVVVDDVVVVVVAVVVVVVGGGGGGKGGCNAFGYHYQTSGTT